MNKWRIIFTDADDAFTNMALDETLLLSCQKGVSPPVLRLYLWSPPAVSIGYFQSAVRTVDLRKCRVNEIDVVRRITGGRAVLHEDEVTYSVCASPDDFPLLGENTMQTYQRLSMALLESLHILGVDGEWVKPSMRTKTISSDLIFSKPCFVSNSRYEITVGGKKLIGSAQRRFSFRSAQGRKDAFIQHGSLLTGNGRYSLAELLPEEGSKELVKKTLEEKSTNLEKILKKRLNPGEIISAFKKGFENVFLCSMQDSEISKEEHQTAQSLREEKYLKEGWILRR